MSRRLAATLTLAAAAVLPACGSSTGPEARWLEESRTYVLRQVAGQDLPMVARDDEWIRIVIRTDTLRLRDDGSGSQVMRVSVTPRGEDAREERWESSFRYELDGDRFELAFVCPPDAISSCIAPPHYAGRVVDGALRLDNALGFPVPFVYQIVDGGD